MEGWRGRGGEGEGGAAVLPAPGPHAGWLRGGSPLRVANYLRSRIGSLPDDGCRRSQRLDACVAPPIWPPHICRPPPAPPAAPQGYIGPLPKAALAPNALVRFEGIPVASGAAMNDTVGTTKVCVSTKA